MSINYRPLEAILKEAGIDPDAVLPTGGTAINYLEACVMGALDEIEENLEESE